MTTTSINTADAKEEFTDLVNRVALNKERIILTRRDKEIAAIVPLEDLKFLEESQSRSDLEDAVAALKEARAQGTISLEELKTEIGE
ncbi:MAG TPA: type II toxin-antitoxin system Phd/YefM family antitoxin [Gammaproteobacteria bacterium]|jgi:prevent-host-death family protein|nr:type II toxin-antitoxin system Phd/YefM family antitoxin [Gammaproteobacteria bacterium]